MRTRIENATLLRHYIRPYWLHLCGAFLALICTSSAVLGMGRALSFLIDQGLGRSNERLLDHAFLILIGVVLLLAGATYVRYFLITWVGERVIADIRRDLYARLIHMHVGYFEHTRVGDILARMTGDTTVMQTVIGSSVSMALRNFFICVGGLVLLFFTSPKLTTYVVLSLPIVVAPIVVLGRRMRQFAKMAQSRVADINVRAEETLSAIRTIQASTMETQQIERFDSEIKQTLGFATERIRARARFTALAIAMIFGAVLTVLYLGGRDVLHGDITPGELSAFVFYSVVVAGSIGALSEVWADIQRAIGAADRISEMLRLRSDIKEPDSPISLQAQKPEIRFESVRFVYPSRPQINALKNVSFSVPAGSTTAIVGPSGAGKSTIFQLMLRYYDVTEGSVRFGQTDIRDCTLQDLRGRMAVVPQEPMIFSASLWENIACANPNAHPHAIEEAAKAAYVDEFLPQLPQGWETFLGEKGVQLSGGQKQRIAIARAIVRNPELLLLDEATNALDSEHEQSVQHALETLMKGRTTMIIAHRLSSVLRADQILCIDHGEIIARGTHAELLQSSALYRRFAELQFQLQS